VGYRPGPPLQRRTRGESRLGGRLGDGDEAEITYRLVTITPVLMRVQPPPPPPPGPKPDLVITDFTPTSVTVKNQGLGPAGPFRVRLEATNTTRTEAFTGLAAGGSETRTIEPPLSACETPWTGMADDLGQVDETDETNNTRPVTPPSIC
jgi:hypothetical protein